MPTYRLKVLDPVLPDKGWQSAQGIFDSYLGRWFLMPSDEGYETEFEDEVTGIAEDIVGDAKVCARVVDSSGATLFEASPEPTGSLQ